MENEIAQTLKESCWHPAYLSSIATFFAAFVALFKESIIGLWRKPKLSFIQETSKIIKEKLPKQYTEKDLEALELLSGSNYENEDTKEEIKAEKYYISLEIINKGKLPAIDCEIILDKLEYKENSDSNIFEIEEIQYSPLNWEKNGKTSIIIPPYQGKARINVIEFLSSDLKSRKKGSLDKNPGLIIGSTSIKTKFVKGHYTAYFSCHSINHKTINLNLSFYFTGNWADRLMEFKKEVKIEVSK